MPPGSQQSIRYPGFNFMIVTIKFFRYNWQVNIMKGGKILSKIIKGQLRIIILGNIIPRHSHK